MTKRDNTPISELRIKLIIGEGQGQVEYKLDARAFRRILTAARPNFERLKREEGKMFPQVEKNALEIINELQFKHGGLI